MKYFLCIYLFFVATILVAQKKDPIPNFNDEYILVKKGDSIMLTLDEVSILPKHKFQHKEDIHYYYWLRRKVFKAYPYAMLASERIDSLQVRLDRIQSKSKKRKYIRKVQKYLEEELTDQIKKLTRTEGRILVKLIHRQTGNTVYQNIKEFRSGWRAFWYNSTANLFKLSLKDTYNPKTVNEDFLIEDILQRAFIDEKLTEQLIKPKQNYKELIANNKKSMNVEQYKKMFAKRKKRKKNKQKRQIKRNQ